MAKHVIIKLDFIPVEERLPDHSEPVFVLIREWRPPINQPWRAYYCLGCGGWTLLQTGQHIEENVAYWAEIPQWSGDPEARGRITPSTVLIGKT